MPLEQIDESGVDTEVRLADAFLEEANSLIEIPADNKTDQAEQTHDTSYILVVDDNPDMRSYLKNIPGQKI